MTDALFDLSTLPEWKDPLWTEDGPTRNPPPIGAITPYSMSFEDDDGDVYWVLEVNGTRYKMLRT